MNTEILCMGCMIDKGNLDVCPECGWKEGTLPESSAQLPPRTALQNQYLLGKVLGQGGFGITYLAWDMNIERKVAVKEYFPHSLAGRADDRTTVSIFSDKAKEPFAYGLSKFMEEGKTLAKFQEHPGIVSVITFLKANDTGYMVMEYVDGMTFKEYLEQQGGKIPFETARKIMMPVMDALREIHSANLLHRDISPDNIYITGKGQIKLLDFGAARYAMGEQSKSLSVILKDGYAPEEQYRTKGSQGPWTDVYALGATFYKAITGETPPQALDRMAADDLIPPSAYGINISKCAEDVLMNSLSVRAENRLQNVREFQELLVEGVKPQPPPGPKSIPVPQKRMPPAKTVTGAKNMSGSFINRRGFVRLLTGWGFILFGIILLLENLDIVRWYEIISFWPIAIVVVGIIVIKNYLRYRQEEQNTM